MLNYVVFIHLNSSELNRAASNTGHWTLHIFVICIQTLCIPEFHIWVPFTKWETRWPNAPSIPACQSSKHFEILQMQNETYSNRLTIKSPGFVKIAIIWTALYIPASACQKPARWCLARCQYCVTSSGEGNLVSYPVGHLPTRLTGRTAFVSPTRNLCEQHCRSFSREETSKTIPYLTLSTFSTMHNNTPLIKTQFFFWFPINNNNSCRPHFSHTDISYLLWSDYHGKFADQPFLTFVYFL